MAVALSFVLLGKGASLSRSGLGEHFSTNWDDDVISEPAIEKKENILSFGHDDYAVAVALMPAPYPPAELEGPSQTTWLWPEAPAAIKGQVGHLIVTVMSPSDDVNPVEHRKLLTRVTASVLATSKSALGAYWGDAGLLIPSGLFVEMATELLPEIPLPLWCDFRVGPTDQDSGISYGFTAGLEPLGHKEISLIGNESSQQRSPVRASRPVFSRIYVIAPKQLRSPIAIAIAIADLAGSYFST